MHAVLLAAILSVPAPDAALDRMRGFLKTPNLRTEFTMDFNDRKGYAAGKILIARPHRLYFSSKSASEDYEYVVNPRVLREVEHKQRVYDDLPFMGIALAPDSEIAVEPAYTFPEFVFAGDFSKLVPPGTKFESLPSQTIDGHRCERIKASYTAMMGSGVIEIAIDEAGRPWFYSHDARGQEGRRLMVFHFKAWDTKPMDAKLFEIPIKNGYVPRYLPYQPFPIPLDRPIPAVVWDSATGKTDLGKTFAGKPYVLLVGAEGCSVSAAAAPFFTKRAVELRGKGFAIASGVLRATPSSKPYLAGTTAVFDRTGAANRVLQLGATPAVLMVDAKGVLRRMWMGYDRKNEARVRTEMDRNATRILKK
ncbi:MAG: hypothetical protein KIS66_10435 [Fimbriimonadaceae bacterium]|nr:hypothetical protein [Fimbriimonadaceae bacterium]